MRDGPQRVFIEVRHRRAPRFRSPRATVDPSQQHRLTLAASHCLPGRGSAPARFEVVGITG